MIKEKRAERNTRKHISELSQEQQLEELRKQKYQLAAQQSFGNLNELGLSYSWKDMEAQDEIRRRERVELRKMQLQNQVAYPTQEIEQSVEHWKYKLHENNMIIQERISSMQGTGRSNINPSEVFLYSYFSIDMKFWIGDSENRPTT